MGKNYYYRFLAQNNAGSVWSPETSSFSSGSFALAADTWPDNDLLLWLDAADVNGDGNFDNEPFAGSVDIWRDKAGGNRHAANGKGPELIYGIQNNRSVLRFNGNEYLRVQDYDPSSEKTWIWGEGTMIFLIKSDSSQPGTYFLSKGWSSSSGWSVFTNNEEYHSWIPRNSGN